MQFSMAFLESGEQALDVFVLGDIAHVGLRSWQGENEVLGFQFQPLVLIGDGELHAGGVESLCDGPGDRALVGDSEDDGVTALQVRGHECSLEWERISAGNGHLPRRRETRRKNQFPIASSSWLPSL